MELDYYQQRLNALVASRVSERPPSNNVKLRDLSTAQKMKFPIKDFFMKCDQLAVSRGSDHNYWRNHYWKTSFFVQFRKLGNFREISKLNIDIEPSAQCSFRKYKFCNSARKWTKSVIKLSWKSYFTWFRKLRAKYLANDCLRKKKSHFYTLSTLLGIFNSCNF